MFLEFESVDEFRMRCRFRNRKFNAIEMTALTGRVRIHNLTSFSGPESGSRRTRTRRSVNNLKEMRPGSRIQPP